MAREQGSRRLTRAAEVAAIVVAIITVLTYLGIKLSSSGSSPTPTKSSNGPSSQPALPIAAGCSSPAEFLDQQPFQGGGPSSKGLVNVDGQYFPHGLEYNLAGTTSSNAAQSIYHLGGCFKTFRALIGFDPNQVQGFSGGAEFQVVADGTVVSSNQFMRGSPICEVSVSIQGVNSLELDTWFVGVEPLYATWGDVRVFQNHDVSGASTFPPCS